MGFALGFLHRIAPARWALVSLAWFVALSPELWRGWTAAAVTGWAVYAEVAKRRRQAAVLACFRAGYRAGARDTCPLKAMQMDERQEGGGATARAA